ncbi:DUF72 domain-containing protein, partial [Stenotrophomonas maltophilia]|uniref:DUF72 domain-containing protein n=1 Tax=Stenotrophomonas maltophilia TaxID=40324 RepID=UPI0022556F77|nr:DUF72 domain-containing protein [Stenotrophomonas maltophilia]
MLVLLFLLLLLYIFFFFFSSFFLFFFSFFFFLKTKAEIQNHPLSRGLGDVKKRQGITSLEEYARHFNCVEGNTTLYALPKPEIVARWYEQTHDDFRFCFKFPATISHQAALRHCDELSSEFFARLAPLASRNGQYWQKLPATFGPRELPALWHFHDGLPRDYTYDDEVRQPEFFAKGEAEQQLNRGLHE